MAFLNKLRKQNGDKNSLYRLLTVSSEQEGAMFRVSIIPALFADMKMCFVMMYFFKMFTGVLEMFWSHLR